MKPLNFLRAAVVAVVLVSTLAPLPAEAKRLDTPQLKAARKRAKAQRRAQRKAAKQVQKQRKAVAQH